MGIPCLLGQVVFPTHRKMKNVDSIRRKIKTKTFLGGKCGINLSFVRYLLRHRRLQPYDYKTLEIMLMTKFPTCSKLWKVFEGKRDQKLLHIQFSSRDATDTAERRSNTQKRTDQAGSSSCDTVLASGANAGNADCGSGGRGAKRQERGCWGCEKVHNCLCNQTWIVYPFSLGL